MKFNLEEAISVLSRTPEILNHLLRDVSEEWVLNNEGGMSWSPKEVLAHLIFGERTDWIPRVRMIIDESTSSQFIPFDMVGHKKLMEESTMQDLLELFSTERLDNLRSIDGLDLQDRHFEMIGIHPEFGPVTLKNHLAAWVVHDLGHIAQITRVMAKQYTDEVGPWTKYMGVLNDRVQKR